MVCIRHAFGIVALIITIAFPSYAYSQNTASVVPVYEIRANNPDKKRHDEILKNLERVPDIFQEQANKFGGRVVIFDGALTDNESMKKYRGRRTKYGLSYDATDGMYNPQTKEAFVDQNPAWAQLYGMLFAPLELHEFSHLINHTVGYPSDSINFKNAWAEAFAKFYYSPESVWYLWRDFPELYEYFYRFEERVKEQAQRGNNHYTK